MRRFENKVAVVTGAAQGIGLASARRLGREGARVLLVDRAADLVADAARELRDAGIDASSFVADLAEAAQARDALRAAADQSGAVHVLVNNVGGTIWKKPFWHYTEEEIRQEVERSFWPPLWCAHAAIPFLRAAGGGAIVNVGSNATDGVYRIPYAACKGAVAALTTSLAAELADFHIRVNCVAPGTTLAPPRKTVRNSRPLSTDETRWEREFATIAAAQELQTRYASTDDQAAIIAFLASDDAAHVTGEIILSGRRGRSIATLLGYVP